jgi:hypothetical protein
LTWTRSADLTATVFCDSSGLRQLVMAHRRAKACHAEVRFAIPHREVLGSWGNATYRKLILFAGVAVGADGWLG